MGTRQLTPAQKLAAERRGALLVSAAAGSGKTSVLTARLMNYVNDPESPCDIDEFLVITYTRAAAAELRGRILAQLSELSALSPQNRRLRRQSSLCYRASIGTIHSFCAAILRENCHRLSLSRDFTVGDEEKCLQLRERALEKTLEAAYAGIGENPDFAALAEGVGYGRDDRKLVDVVSDMHARMQSHPYPETWARQCIAAMETEGVADIADTLWGAEIMREARETASFWVGKLGEMWEELLAQPEENEELLKKYGPSIEETMSALSELSRALERGWDEARRVLPIPFPGLTGLRKYEFPERKDYFNTLRDACKKDCERLAEYFDAPSAEQLRELRGGAPAMRALFELALEFDRNFALQKRRRNLLDFSDLEHFAVRLLRDEETGEPTDIARALSARYREILVDEYQDVNAVQELILSSVSRDGGNLFMVGDVKQSIYRFRLADPEIFLGKLSALPRAEAAEEGEGAAVLLKQNFRSDRRILTACNSIFGTLMSRELGDIDYDDDCALNPPESAPEPRGEVKMSVISVRGGGDGDSEDKERPDAVETEAAFVAGRIKELVRSGEKIRERDALRPVRYGDIAVLMLSPGRRAGIYRSVFAREGIPVDAGQGGGFFAAPEIVVMIQLLKVIDNPHRDIALTAVLNSPVFRFTPDDLAGIRVADRDADIYSALRLYAEEDEKSREFLRILGELRALSADLSVYELINHIYSALELPAVWTAARGSDEAATNLLSFAELASKLGDGGWRGIPEFLSRLEIMEARGLAPAAAHTGGEDCVRILSIHKSKGLEFPVVFLSDTARAFNKQDLRAAVQIHSELGPGAKVLDPERGLVYPGIAYRAIKSRREAELVSELMRVLYVALTRAKEKLFITCGVSKPEEFVSKLAVYREHKPEARLLKRYTNMAKWLAAAALADETGSIELETVYPDSETAQAEEAEERPAVSEAELRELREALDFRYPHEGAAALPSKITATSLRELEADPEALALAPPQERSFELPGLLGESRPLSAAEKGTATHIVMQFVDFARTASLEELEAEIARIYELGQLDSRQAAAVDRRALLGFFASELGGRIRAAQKVYREFRFSLLVPAERFFPGAGDEELLLQGVVDCCIEEAGALTVIDYKTDYVTPETLPEKLETYRPQLEAYALAMSRITGKKVSGCVLYFLRAGLSAELSLSEDQF